MHEAIHDFEVNRLAADAVFKKRAKPSMMAAGTSTFTLKSNEPKIAAEKVENPKLTISTSGSLKIDNSDVLLLWREYLRKPQPLPVVLHSETTFATRDRIQAEKKTVPARLLAKPKRIPFVTIAADLRVFDSIAADRIPFFPYEKKPPRISREKLAEPIRAPSKIPLSITFKKESTQSPLGFQHSPTVENDFNDFFLVKKIPNVQKLPLQQMPKEENILPLQIQIRTVSATLAIATDHQIPKELFSFHLVKRIDDRLSAVEALVFYSVDWTFCVCTKEKLILVIEHKALLRSVSANLLLIVKGASSSLILKCTFRQRLLTIDDSLRLENIVSRYIKDDDLFSYEQRLSTHERFLSRFPGINCLGAQRLLAAHPLQRILKNYVCKGAHPPPEDRQEGDGGNH